MSLIIVDVPASQEVVNRLQKLGLTLLDVQKMTKQMQEFELWDTLDTKSTLFLFPGNGANDVKRRLPQAWLQGWKVESVSAKRFCPAGYDPRTVIGPLNPPGLRLGISNVVVIDDVISSGTTMARIHQRHSIWIPGAKWHAACWVRQQAPGVKGLRHFSSIHAVEMVGSPERRIPINSLSTLLEDEVVRKNYFHHNFQERLEEITCVFQCLLA